MKEKLRERRGITLIALVITIIVLLLLASVSIAMLTGENGILTRASEAKVETRGGAVQEARDLWKSNKKADELAETETVQTLDELLADLKEQNQLTDEEIAIIKETGKVTIGSRTIEFFETEEIKDYKEYRLGESRDDNDKMVLSIHIQTENLITELVADEEIFIEVMKLQIVDFPFNTFEEFVEAGYKEGVLKEKYKTLEEFALAPELNLSSEEHEWIKNEIQTWKENAEISLLDPKGEILEWGYEVPYEMGTYIFTAKITKENREIIKKFKITIDKYEIIEELYSSYVYACDIENKKYLKIDSGKYIENNQEYEISPEYIEDMGTHSAINYYHIGESGELKKLILQCGEEKVEGYIIWSNPT